MEKDKVINKILRDLKQFELINEEDNGKIKMHLELLYVAAWNEGRRSLGIHNERKIEQLNEKRKRIAEYNSILSAARINSCSTRLIQRALTTGKQTRTKHYWKYKKAPVIISELSQPKINHKKINPILSTINESLQ